MSTARIIINNVSFHLEHSPIAFEDLNLSFQQQKYGIIGANGAGKTTLLKLLTGALTPDRGSIQCSGSLALVPQSHADLEPTICIAEILGVAAIIQALQHINQGSTDVADFECVDQHWDIEERIEKSLRHLQLWPIDISMPFSTLSGGQKTKILLAKTLIFPADFMLFDEPTNNLDKQSRHILADYIQSQAKGFIIISHDRSLLNLMDHIIEITTKGIQVYGGNYDFYQQQKQLAQQALQRQYDDAKRAMKNTEKTIQDTREKHQKSAVRGRKAFLQGKVDRITALSKKGRSEKTKEKMATQEEKMLADKQTSLASIKEKLEHQQDLNLSLASTRVANSKMVLDIESLNFQYPGASNLLIKDFNLNITGPERIAIVGPNGCGKSTLLQLIRHQLSPCSGSIKIGVEQMSYLDQAVSMLEHDSNLIDNFLKLNPDANTFDAYQMLARFDFRNKQAEKLVSSLSGGEKIRAGLAISLMAKQPPQLIILDEPTNHLDLRAIAAVEHMLGLYQGAVIAVSHDERFLENIMIDRLVEIK